ncbi:hypothetical protein [Paenibacillus sp. GCM10023250]|uniref:hypothetical protein n=1 Tax=Paenibacillus sp. GCM10023250 TaxID=3252648 RepID=UPI00361ABA77
MEQTIRSNYSNDKSVLLYLCYPLLFQIAAMLLTVNLLDIKLSLLFIVLNAVIFTYLFIYYINNITLMIINIIIMISFQNLFIGLGDMLSAYQSSGLALRPLLIYKEIISVIVLVLLYLKTNKKIRINNYEKIVPVLVIYLLIELLISGAQMESKLYYLRTYLIPFVCYLIGRMAYFEMKTKSGIKPIINTVTVIGVMAVVIGFIFLLISVDSSLWRDIFHLGLISEAKTGRYEDFPRWYTPIGPLYLRRMFSFFFDSISLSYFLITSLICSMLIRKRIMLPIQLLLFAGLIFTFGKGAIGMLLILMVIIICIHYMKINAKWFVTAFLVVMGIAYEFVYNFNFRSSASVHFDGLMGPLMNIFYSPLGHGLGIGGNYFAILNNVKAWDISSTGAESFIGVMIYQLGFPGIVMFLFFFISMMRNLLSAYATADSEERFRYIVLYATAFSILIASLFQESTMGLNYTGILFMLIGFYVSKSKEFNVRQYQAKGENV